MKGNLKSIIFVSRPWSSLNYRFLGASGERSPDPSSSGETSPPLFVTFRTLEKGRKKKMDEVEF